MDVQIQKGLKKALLEVEEIKKMINEDWDEMEEKVVSAIRLALHDNFVQRHERGNCSRFMVKVEESIYVEILDK